MHPDDNRPQTADEELDLPWPPPWLVRLADDDDQAEADDQPEGDDHA